MSFTAVFMQLRGVFLVSVRFGRLAFFRFGMLDLLTFETTKSKPR